MSFEINQGDIDSSIEIVFGTKFSLDFSMCNILEDISLFVFHVNFFSKKMQGAKKETRTYNLD
ncbi:hypothetical protein LguiA_010686 [Lonicera macranthoides]